jgi:imidazolonepropionase-like amidohydrolase
MSALALHCPLADGGLLLLKNAHIVDPARRVELVGHVLIDNAKVVDVLTQAPTQFSGAIVDLEGRYLIPGLVDVHVHSGWNRAPVGSPDEELAVEETARRMLVSGVTAYLDLGSDPNSIFPVRDKLRAVATAGMGPALGADIFAAGPVFVSVGRPGFSRGALIVQNRMEARRELDRLAQKRPDVIKIIFDWAGGRHTMSEEVMRALVEHARELELKTVVHIGTWENAKLAADAGATAITHLDDTTDFPESLTQAMGAKQVFSIPTMAVQQDFLNILEDHGILDSPLLRMVATGDLLDFYRGLDPTEYADCPACRWQREGRKHYGVSLARLVQARVPIVAGSDTGNLGTFQGFSLHRELVLLHRWGLSSWDALAAGTSRAYQLLGLEMGFAKGADATFVVLAASPVEDIANTQRIERILFHGQWVDRTPIAAPH